jgi:hypothetical protein
MSGILQTLFLGAAAAVKDAYFNLVTLLLPGNGTNGAQNNTFLDSSTNNFTITRNGNTTQGTFSPFSQTGWGNYFGSSSDYLTTPASNSSATFGTGTYTVEAWIYPTAYNASNSFFLGSNGSGTFQAGLTSAGYLFGSCAAVGNFTASTSIIPLNTWTHVALVRNSTSSNGGTYYVNGVAAGTYTDANNYTATPNVWIGTTSPATSYFFSGYISNLRVVKGSTVYTGNFTPSTTPLTAITNTSLLTCQSNRFVDNSSNNYSLTTNGTPSVQAFSPFAPTAAYSSSVVGGSGYFDGSGDYLTAPSGAAVSGSGAFTVEFWVYMPSTNSGARIVSGAANQLTINMSSDGSMSYGKNGVVDVITVAAGTSILGQWTHIAIGKASGGTARIWRNGASVGTATDSQTYTAGTVYIGASSTPGNYLTGYISGLKISASDVYGTSNTTITIPTAPPSSSGAQLLLNYTNAGITDATAKNDLETVGNAQISTTQSKFGGSSMAFDGNGDFLQGPNTNYLFGSGNFTVEGWIYPSGTTGLQYIASVWGISGQSDATYSSWVLRLNAANLEVVLQPTGGGGLTTITGTGSGITANTWQYVAVVRNGSTVTLYINGSSVGSGTFSATLNSPVSVFAIGAQLSNNNTFNGYIDDLRITKYARTIATPTAAFPLQ